MKSAPKAPCGSQSEDVTQVFLNATRLFESPVVVGFDAFVDESIRIVGTRKGPGRFELMTSMAEFGNWICASSGRSGGREYIPGERTAGGCSLNLADGLAHLGVPVHAFVGMGEPPDPVFDHFRSKVASAVSAGMGPGHSIAMEFPDGKILLGSFAELEKVTPEFLEKNLMTAGYAEACGTAKAVVLTSWSVYPHMTACWEFLIDKVFSRLANRPIFFFDLADPVSKPREELVAMCRVLGQFAAFGRVCLSLNGNEATRLARALALPEQTNETGNVLATARELRKRMGIDEVVIHLVDAAAVAARDEMQVLPGPYCPEPVRTVGAGDRFNAGYLAGMLCGCSPVECLAAGNAASGFFVRTAQSASIDNLLNPTLIPVP